MQRKITLHTFTDTGYNSERKLSTTRNIIITESPGPVEFAVQNEHKEILHNAIKTLPDNEANVIRLRFLSQEYVGYRPIAKRLDCSHEQVRKLVASGLEKLQFLLSNLNESGMPGSRPFTGNIPETVPVPRPGRETYRQAQRLNLTTEERKERKKQHAAEWYEKNKERINREHKEDYRENKGVWYVRNKNWQEKNKEAHTKYQRQYHKVYAPQYNKKQVERLTDGYVKSIIVGKSRLSTKDIPQELIELKRRQLKLTRLIQEKEKEQENEHSTNQNGG
jgi:hypothetical protein